MPNYLGQTVSDDYTQSLLLAYRQCYVNAGGPDYEDSDLPLLHMFESLGFTSGSECCQLGREHAARDIARGMESHQAEQYAPNTSFVPTTAPPVLPVASGGDAQAFVTLPNLPTGGGSAAPNPGAAGIIATTPLYGGNMAGSGGGLLGGLFGGTSGKPNLLLWLLIGGGVYYFAKRK